MKLLDNIFTIKKASYPHCNNLYGKFKIEILKEDDNLEMHNSSLLIEIIKECAQFMIHDHITLNAIANSNFILEDRITSIKNFMIDIKISHLQNDLTNPTQRIKATVYNQKPNIKYLDISAEFVKM